MITCERCKTENLDGAQYCDECGRPFGLTRDPTQASIPQAQIFSRRTPTDRMVRDRAPQFRNPKLPARQPRASTFRRRRDQPLRPHARLVIERGNSVGKQFTLSADESQIGRWDADGGIFPDVDLDSDDPEAKVSRRHARITLSDGQVFFGRSGIDQRNVC